MTRTTLLGWWCSTGRTGHGAVWLERFDMMTLRFDFSKPQM
jgi:hypothetical protein